MLNPALSNGPCSGICGEWRHVEQILSITSGDKGALVLHAGDSSEARELVSSEDGKWEACGSKSDEAPYEIRISDRGKDTLNVRNGEQSFSIHRVAKSRTILGEWRFGSKSLCVEDSGAYLTLSTDGHSPLRMVRRRITEWDALNVESKEAVYLVEHTEGSQSIAIRRPASGPDQQGERIEFTRPGVSAAGSQEHSGRVSDRGSPEARRAHSRGRSRHRSRSRDRERGHGCNRSRSGSGRGRSRQRQRRSSGAGQKRDPPNTVDEFVHKNGLLRRTEMALKELGSREQRHVMGLDGGRNGFILIGRVRDPDAVVMSRIKRLSTEPLPARRSRSRSGGGRRSRSHGGRRHRDKSRSRHRSRDRVRDGYSSDKDEPERRRRERKRRRDEKSRKRTRRRRPERRKKEKKREKRKKHRKAKKAATPSPSQSESASEDGDDGSEESASASESEAEDGPDAESDSGSQASQEGGSRSASQYSSAPRNAQTRQRRHSRRRRTERDGRHGKREKDQGRCDHRGTANHAVGRGKELIEPAWKKRLGDTPPKKPSLEPTQNQQTQAQLQGQPKPSVQVQQQLPLQVQAEDSKRVLVVDGGCIDDYDEL